MATTTKHDWTFNAAGVGNDPFVVIACRVCGLIRAEQPGRGDDDRHVDLTGDCPGEPQQDDPTTSQATWG
jgi:hypothetical protein